MKQSVTILVLTAILWLLVGSPLAAAGRARGKLFARPGSTYTATTRVEFSRPAARYYPTAEELYPKYYGSFHYRHLDNLGVPTGDIGLRGNGLYWSPW